LKRQVAVIDSMTRQERKSPDILKASRKKRIAAGAGLEVQEVNKLLKMHRNMADMMKAMGSGKRGPMAGIAKMKNQIANAGIDDRILKRQVAVIDSMTRQERKNPDILKASRKKRIAAGSGVKVEDINRMLKMHRNMSDVMKAMGSGKRGPMAGLANMLGLGSGMPSPEQMAEMAKKMPGGLPGAGGGGLPPTMPGLPPRFPGLPGLGGPKLPAGLPGLGKKK